MKTRMFAAAALISGLCLAVVGLSTQSGFRIVRPESLPLRFALALTPLEMVAGRERWKRVDETPAVRRGLPHDGVLVAYECLLLACSLGLLLCLKRSQNPIHKGTKGKGSSC